MTSSGSCDCDEEEQRGTEYVLSLQDAQAFLCWSLFPGVGGRQGTSSSSSRSERQAFTPEPILLAALISVQFVS